MNLLIAGGLLAFAIVAILVAVFLSIGDQRSQQPVRVRDAAPLQPAVTATPTPEPRAQVNTSYRRTIPLSRELTNSTTLEKPARISQPLASPLPASLPHAEQSELSFRFMTGQIIHDLADELRSLHQQAWELEQRLSSMTEMLDRADHTNFASDRHHGLDEEVTQEQFPAEAM